jgi:hypothetical protein
LMIFSAPDAPIKGFKFSLNTQKNGALPLDLACLEH